MFVSSDGVYLMLQLGSHLVSLYRSLSSGVCLGYMTPEVGLAFVFVCCVSMFFSTDGQANSQ